MLVVQSCYSIFAYSAAGVTPFTHGLSSYNLQSFVFLVPTHCDGAMSRPETYLAMRVALTFYLFEL